VNERRRWALRWTQRQVEVRVRVLFLLIYICRILQTGCPASEKENALNSENALSSRAREVGIKSPPTSGIAGVGLKGEFFSKGAAPIETFYKFRIATTYKTRTHMICLPLPVSPAGMRFASMALT